MSRPNVQQSAKDAVPVGRPRRGLGRLILASVGGLVAAGVIAAGAGFAGYWASENDIPDKVVSRYLRPALQTSGVAEAQQVAWRTVPTGLHELQIAEIAVNIGGSPTMSAMETVGDNIVFVSRQGRFGYLAGGKMLKPLDMDTPMGFEAMRAAGLYDDLIFQVDEVRTTDLLSVQTGPSSSDLYAVYNRYTGKCFELVVGRMPLEVTPDGVRPLADSWEDIYVARPCIAIKDRGMRFAGHEGGGRLVRLDDATLLLSVGVYQFDGVTGDLVAGMDPETDLGKIIAIDLPTKTGRIYAQGMRNPQGLLVTRDGRVWQTEHGPQGGDEVNLIREGANYGWPIVSYGMDYGTPPQNLPFSDKAGSHDGYERPRFSFVPSVGISNIIQPDPREFPDWDSHLVATSLAKGSLFILKLEGDDIVYAEPVSFNGARIRDILSLPDGRLAVLLEYGAIALVRNSQMHGEDEASVTVAGLSSLLPPVEAAIPDAPTTDVLGARIFFYQCGSCHSNAGEAGVGPSLDGVFGRPVGAAEGYGYSTALRDANAKWNERTLRAFIRDAQGTFPGTTMPQVTIAPYQIDGLIRYLRDLESAGPSPG